MDKKYLILTPGRTGSTLLSAILAQCGAEFGMDNPNGWNRQSGYYEHNVLDRAYKWFRASEESDIAIWPFTRLSGWLLERCKANLNSLFQRVSFAKSLQLVYIVHPIVQLGYEVRIILSYRSFNGYAVSKHRHLGWDLDQAYREYQRVNRTGLFLMELYGGCAVSYQELTDPSETAWGECLEQLTDFNSKEILEARDELVKESRHDEIRTTLHPDAESLYEALRKYKGRVINSSFFSSQN